MNKKIISFVTAFFMIFTLFDFPAGAVNGFTIEDDTLKNYYGDGGDVVVPDGVKHIADMAFLNESNITSVTLPNSITSIGESAFAGCTSLTEITIPAGVTAIEPFVFDGCQNLQNVTFHDNVESIGEFSFRQCSMTSLHIPDSVKTIGANAFAVCKNLQTVNIPNGIEAIEYGIFQGCSKLSSIEIPDSVKAIGYYAFSSCEALTSITIPDSVEEIGEGAFLGCTGLTSINIPSSVTSIGSMAFYNCYYLDMITYPKELDVSNAWFPAAATKVEYTVENGEVTITDIILGAGTGETEVEIPETINGVPVTSVNESVRDKVSESGHTHKGGTATCTQKAVCALCGLEYGEMLPHTGGTASCTAKAVCDACGQEYGELAAHTLSKTPAVSPTCTAAGNKEYWTCSVCQKMFADGSGTAEITAIPTIAALPHNFVNGVCADCGEPDPDYSQPTETEPPVTEPPVTDPSDTEPTVTEPPVTDPSDTEPTVTNPPVTDPSDTEPTVTNPPVTDPSDTEPTVTNPPVTDPSGTEPPVTVPPVTAPRETYPSAKSPSGGYPLVIPYGYTTSSNEKMFEALAGASDGDTVVIDLNGNTDIDKSVFDEIRGRDVTVRFRLKGGAYWTVNGKDIEQSRKVDLGVRMNRMSASRDEIKELAGNKKTVKFTLRHNGKLGFSGILNVPINDKYNGKYANLYYYGNGFEFIAGSIISDGYAQFRFDHASEYIIVIDDYPHGEDISAAAGAQCDDTPIDGSGHEDSGKAPAYFTDENKIRITNRKRRYRILKRRRLEDIVFLL